MCKKLLSISRLFIVIGLISLFLLTSACIGIYYPLTTSVNPAGEGTVSPSGGSYLIGTLVTLTATPATGWTFSGWSGSSDLGSTTANPTTITMNSPETVTATFTSGPTTMLTYTAGANGSISGTSPQTVNYGSSGTAVTAVPTTGYHFVNWSDSSTANPRTDTNVTANVTVSATFAINTYTLTYAAGANGSISGTSPQTVNYGSSGTAVMAVPANGYHFVNWSDSSTANPRTDTNVTANISVTATFTQIIYTLTTSVNPAGESTVSPSDGSYPSGTSVILTATAATRWTFSGWSGSTDLASTTANPTTITMKSNETVIATFILTSPNVKIQSVTLPSSVIANSGISYPTTFRLVNNESVNVTVTWKANSSVTGNFDNGSVTVPANGYVNVPKSYVYTDLPPIVVPLLMLVQRTF